MRVSAYGLHKAIDAFQPRYDRLRASRVPKTSRQSRGVRQERLLLNRSTYRVPAGKADMANRGRSRGELPTGGGSRPGGSPAPPIGGIP